MTYKTKTMNVAIPVPRDEEGRITLSQSDWSARLDRGFREATALAGGVEAWRFGEVVGDDESGDVVVRLISRKAAHLVR